MAEAFKKRGQTGRRGDMMDVTVVEMADHILPTMLDTQRHWNIFTGHRHNKRTSKELSADPYITVETVTGEVVDLIYQIKPLEFFGDCYWVNDHR
jgi:NADPH-dependent 2,4-dienoyl-CoA reductase/sulfur reductase-like enzyme